MTYQTYARYARYTGHGLHEKAFSNLMRGERGEFIRKAADEEKREENLAMIKLLYAIVWVVNILSILTDTVSSALGVKDKEGVFERTKPDIFKENTGNNSNKKHGKVAKTIEELHSNPVLHDTRMWD